MDSSPVTPTKLFKDFMKFLEDRFNLHEDKALEIETVNEIKRNVVFSGANLWILIFAIFIASVGLNVNSTAVVIGAMLISPLMGPIMGVGLGAGINDLELIFKSLKNLVLAAVISILTSALYFKLSPLTEAQSEILSRTSPTVFDVLIAFFGGLAGIVAASRTEKSNAIPGVAIATALMPPLCTAGYGLANGQLDFFYGALYLFFINSVFISISTYIIIRFLSFTKKEFLDHKKEKAVKRYIAAFAIITMIPSIYTAFKVANESIYISNETSFYNNEIASLEDCVIISHELSYHPDSSTIKINLYGQGFDDNISRILQSKLSAYHLNNTKLLINKIGDQNIGKDDLRLLNTEIKSDIMKDFYQLNQKEIEKKDSLIDSLKLSLSRTVTLQNRFSKLSKELNAINSNIKFSSFSKTTLDDSEGNEMDTILVAYLKTSQRLSDAEEEAIKRFISTRCEVEEVKLFIEKI
ncbi:MAG TPA: TIGR00341 family protein [Saprospiraceae bacterium]|nr:TIGR00341 family protein [Saprospiraceae bacterium]MCB9328317.1 TIGR00341 family protein [Lewinellaceae bacterium]HRX28526.1 TIGR00341 family protein [Saprospiraceae bacterium]